MPQPLLKPESFNVPPGEIATMSHVCSSLKCTYVIGLSGYMREVKVNC